MSIAEQKSKLVAEAKAKVMHGRSAKSILALPVVQEFFVEELALAMEEFVTADKNSVGALAACSLRAQLVLALANHFEEAVRLGDSSENSLRNTEREN